ncbi:MAG: AIPR family protein [Tepidisphaeraceae bacterium]
MRITDQAIDQALADLKKTCGNVRQDYFGLLYLEQEHGVPREQAVVQVAFGGNDYGVDAFHFDRERRNFYLFQFKYSESYQQFKASFQRLIDDGMRRLFGAEDQDSTQNQLVQQIKASLLENQAIIERFYVHFVFLGDPEAAEQSKVLEDLRETLENKKFLIENFLGRAVTLAVEFKSARSKRIGGASHVHKTRVYPLHLSDVITRDGPGDERMSIGFVRLVDLQAMFADMGQRFFERNIRAALPPEGAVNRALKATFKRIILDEKESPQVFAFNHNGVTLAAEAVAKADGAYRITSPRLLNGAQTVTTFARFMKENEGNPRLVERHDVVEQLHVLCRIVTGADADFITTVTINNNRQNKVEPWNLRANDRIQLELADKLKDEVGLYYERQENAFKNLSDVEIEELEVEGSKAIELYKLAQTFAVTDGEIDKLSRMVEVFENEQSYAQLFSPARLKLDSRKIVLCYKAGLYAGRLAREVEAMGQKKYEFVRRGRNMLWALIVQGMLNDKEVNNDAEEWGRSLRLEIEFRNWLLDLATTRCRFILSDLIDDKQYRDKVAEGKFDFLRNATAFKKAMDFAYKRFKWTIRGLA